VLRDVVIVVTKHVKFQEVILTVFNCMLKFAGLS